MQELPTTRNGLFVSIEGGEAAGKTTQIAALADKLREKDVDYLVSKQPGATKWGLAVRKALLSGEGDRARQETLAMAMVSGMIDTIPLISEVTNRGGIFITDRWFETTKAYQSTAPVNGAPPEFMDALGSLIGIRPDITFVLTLDLATAQQRLAERGRALDHFELLGDKFHRRVHQYFEALPKRCNWCYGIDATMPKDVITDAILRTIAAHYKAKRGAAPVPTAFRRRGDQERQPAA